jgi:microcystin-dependent protein
MDLTRTQITNTKRIWFITLLRRHNMSVKFISPLTLPVGTSDQDNNLGQIYFNSTTKKIRVYKNSGWADIGGSTSGSSGKAGMITSWAGSYTNVPSGWLLCDGSAVSRTTYADLFAVIGTNFGAGDGSTTFNLPDYQLYWLIGAPSSLSTAPNPSGAPSSWVVTTGTAFYGSFAHSTNGAHSSHATSMTSSGGHSHTGGHTHSVTSSNTDSSTDGSHTVSGAFNSAGAAHTHSPLTVVTGSTGPGLGGGATTGAGGDHIHTVSLASGGSGSNHQVSGDSYSGTATHGGGHTHTAGSATSDTQGSSTGTNADHTHTMSAIASSGDHAHATHDPKRQTMYYIIKT